MLSLSLYQTVSPRLTLVQKLGLESRFLSSCLVRTEQLLMESHHQRALVLLRGRDEEDYRSVLDYLLALLLPTMRPAIIAYYEDEGPRLVEMAPAPVIAAIDNAMADCVRQLAQLHAELVDAGSSVSEKAEVVDHYLDFVARPAVAAAATGGAAQPTVARMAA